MEQIIVKRADGTTFPLLSKSRVSTLTKAEQKIALLGDDIVDVSISSAKPIEFALGDTIEVYGKTYTLNVLPNIKKAGTKRFTYDLTFEGPQYELIDAQFLLPEETTTGDSLTGDLTRFLQILIENVTRIFPGKWRLGTHPTDTEYKNLTYGGKNCLEVLQDLCDQHGQEFEILQNNGVRTLNIKTAGTNFPYTFRYGKTGGLYELMRQNINSKNLVTRLFVYGGSSNLGNKYRHSRLCLPGKSKNCSYIENAAAIAAFGLKENIKNFEDIFPNRYGKVTSKGTKDYAFVDDTMNFDLNEKDSDGITTKWLIAGVNAKVKMTTGNLAGYEFDVHKYTHATKTIEVVPFTDENGMKFPSETSAAFQFTPGDKYFFIDINLPDSYKTDAEADLQEEGETYYNQNCQPQVQYGLNIDQNFIEQFAGNLTVVNLFAVGDYVPVEDEDIGVEKSIRILGFTRDLLKPYKYSLNLGDSVTKSAYTRIISDLKTIDKIVEINNLADPSSARRNWRASQEVLAMVFDPDGDYYSEKIKPLSVETSMLAVGAKSMQFVLRNVVFEPNYQSNPNYVGVSGGQLIHYAIEDTIRTWNMAAVTHSNLVSETAYYIYARCEKTGNAGSIVLDTVQRSVDYEVNYYNFMVGVLNSVDMDNDGANPARLVALTYGSSTINGRFIKTGRIESSGGGTTYFDLDNGEIGGNIKFISSDGTTKDVSEIEKAVQEKRRVFTATPTVPYDVGDLWVNDTDLRRCATARASGSYNANDWVMATSYDNTVTTINGGIVTSGTVQLAGNDNNIKAGITGEGTADTSVRIWAGGSYDNRAAAPFRVLQDGSLVATKATIEGNIKATSGSIGGFSIGNGRIGQETSESSPSTDGLSLYNTFIRFVDAYTTAMLGSNTLPPSSGGTIVAQSLRVKRTWSNTAPQSNIALVLSAQGNPHAYTDVGRSDALLIEKGNFAMNDGSMILPVTNVSTSGQISTRNALVISLRAGVSSTITLQAGWPGQMIIIVNNSGSSKTISQASSDRTLQNNRQVVLVYISGVGWCPHTD